MSEDLDVRWRRARAWLESVRYAALRIEPLVREIAAMQDAYEQMLPWQSQGAGSGSARTHSDPTASQALARSEGFEINVERKQARLDVLTQTVGDCGRVLMRLADALTDEHSLALELYYVDCAATWSDVAEELGRSRKWLWQLRDEAYGWIESNVDRLLR